jgi:hypothetical protein
MNPMYPLVLQRSTQSLSTLVDFLSDYQIPQYNAKVFDGYLSKLMELNVNIEEILGNEAVWDTIYEKEVFPTIGLNHKFSFTSQYNPILLKAE